MGHFYACLLVLDRFGFSEGILMSLFMNNRLIVSKQYHRAF